MPRREARSPTCGHGAEFESMARFTLQDLAATIDARAASGGAASYTRKLLDKGAAHCAKKFGEEAVETVIAAVGERPRPPDRRKRRSAVSSAGAAEVARHRRSTRSRPRWRAHRPFGPRREGRAQARLSVIRLMEQRHGYSRSGPAVQSLPDFSRDQWAQLRDDTPMTLDAGEVDAAALDARPARHQGGRGDLSAAVAAAVALRRRHAAAVQRAAAVPRHPRTARCPTSSASRARSRSANPPPRACCRRCWRAGRRGPRSISSPPTAFSIPTPCSSAKA